jgi:alkylated DNA nucleotide flippase Atl1
MQLNETLLKELPRILYMTNKAISAQSNIANATWYRIVSSPSKISVQQLIDLANGLHIPVSRFISRDGTGVIVQRDNLIISNGYQNCYYDSSAVQKVISSGIVSSYRDAASIVGLHPNRVKESLLAIHRLPVSRLLDFCTTLKLNPFEFIVDPNIRMETNEQIHRLVQPLGGITLPENFIERHLEIAKLRKELFDTKYELEILRRNQNNNNDMEKKVIKAPVTWFYGIRFDLEFDDMSEPVLAWFKMLVKKEYPYYEFFFAKTGSEYNSVRFYTKEGIIFFEVGCETDLANYLFRERIMVGKIWAYMQEDNPNGIEFKADLVANTREDSEDTVDLALFRKEMIQKFG